MDDDHFLIGLIALLSLAKIRLSIGLILLELEPAILLDYGHSLTTHFLKSGSGSDPQKHYFIIAQCKHSVGSCDAFTLTSFLRQVDLQPTCITACNTISSKFSSFYSQ